MDGTFESPAGAALSDSYCQSIVQFGGASRFVQSAGGRIHYLVWDTAPGNAPVLIFVHGMLGHAHWWDVIAPFFATHYKVLALDLSGMGDSTHRDVYDSRVFTSDIAAVVEKESQKQVTIVGHSFGGSRTLMACVDRPELFCNAVLIDSPIWQIGDKLPQRRPRGDRVYRDKDEALGRFRLAPEQPVCSQALRRYVGEHSLKEVEGGWRWKFDPLLSIENSLVDPATFDAIRVPLDFIRGERSRVLPEERMQRMAKNLKILRRVITIPAGHHHLMLDQPLALVGTLRALLA